MMSCAWTDCLDCGHRENHKHVDKCSACGSTNVAHESDNEPMHPAFVVLMFLFSLMFMFCAIASNYDYCEWLCG